MAWGDSIGAASLKVLRTFGEPCVYKNAAGQETSISLAEFRDGDDNGAVFEVCTKLSYFPEFPQVHAIITRTADAKTYKIGAIRREKDDWVRLEVRAVKL